MEGRGWNMTEDRRKVIVTMLRQQHTLASIHSLRFSSISYQVFTIKVKESGIDWKQERKNGLLGMRAAAFRLTDSMETEKDMFDAKMRFLGKYDLDLDTVEEVDAVDTNEIKQSILDELNG